MNKRNIFANSGSIQFGATKMTNLHKKYLLDTAYYSDIEEVKDSTIRNKLNNIYFELLNYSIKRINIDYAVFNEFLTFSVRNMQPMRLISESMMLIAEIDLKMKKEITKLNL